MLRLPTTFANIATWVRDAATAINSLIYLTENPQVEDVRYHAGVLEYWDGTAWQPVP